MIDFSYSWDMSKQSAYPNHTYQLLLWSIMVIKKQVSTVESGLPSPSSLVSGSKRKATNDITPLSPPAKQPFPPLCSELSLASDTAELVKLPHSDDGSPSDNESNSTAENDIVCD